MAKRNIPKESTNLAGRQRQAFNLVSRGHSIPTVAKMMGMTSATIRDYVSTKKEEIKGTVEQIGREDYVGLILSRREAVRTEAYANYSSCSKMSDRVKLLRLIMDNDSGELGDLQALGLIEKKVDQKVVTHEVRGTVELKEVNPNKLDALAAMFLAEKMGVTPEQAVDMCGRRGVGALDVPVLDVGEPLQLQEAEFSDTPTDGSRLPKVYPVTKKAAS